ncbi:MAG: hypothetical protein Alpg2KO_24100 [Alphaproteobacteria bacterium]
MTESFIALEIHDVSLWEPSRVLPLLQTMQNWGYNALVLHQNDILDCCTQLGLTANYGVSDLRLKKVRNNVAWLNDLTRRLADIGARLFLEIKEPSFHDYALEPYPHLIGPDGLPDPMHPDWPRFCQDKTADLLARVPDLGGLIITLSSPESRVSLPDYLATAGQGKDIGIWFDDMIAAFHSPLSAAGKSLYIRDFSYTAEMASDVLAAVNRCGGAVGASVKITAHDYFPDYPENPAAGLVKAPLIFEFEAFGEHMGWGVIPNCRVGEFQQRLHSYHDRKATGLLMRTSWEAITGTSALDSLSAVNVFALPHMIKTGSDPRQAICAWLDQGHDLRGETASQAADLMLQSWHIPAAAYWDGQVFPRHSCLPSSWQEGWLSMTSDGMGRRDRDLRISPNDPRLTDQAGQALFEAKDKAVALAHNLSQQADAIRPHLPSGLAQQFRAFQWIAPFAEQFAHATKATFHAARASCAAADDLDQVAHNRRSLLELADRLQTRLDADTELPHHHRMLFDPDQIRLFCTSLP